jgi:hypothetical protein
MTVQAIAYPSTEQLLALEHKARQHGTALDVPALQGCWQLELVWPKGSGRPAAFSGWLLRGLSARLEISAVTDEGLALSNAVNLGPLELRFRGVGQARCSVLVSGLIPVGLVLLLRTPCVPGSHSADNDCAQR